MERQKRTQGRQTDRLTVGAIKTDRQRDRNADRQNRETDLQLHRQIDRQIYRLAH